MIQGYQLPSIQVYPLFGFQILKCSKLPMLWFSNEEVFKSNNSMVIKLWSATTIQSPSKVRIKSPQVHKHLVNFNISSQNKTLWSPFKAQI